jgi:hypothetical protein
MVVKRDAGELRFADDVADGEETRRNRPDASTSPEAVPGSRVRPAGGHRWLGVDAPTLLQRPERGRGLGRLVRWWHPEMWSDA